MLPRTLPGRITSGFIILLLITLSIGAASLWRVFAINERVVMLATNLVPSVIALNKVIQSNFSTMKVLRTLLLSGVAAGRDLTAEEAAFTSAKARGEQACIDYERLFSDAEDARLFQLARQARSEFLSQADGVFAALKAGKQEEASALFRGKVDPALDACMAAFNTSIEYNNKITAQQARLAENQVATSVRTIGGGLAAAILAGSGLGLLITFWAKRSLSQISQALDAGATSTALASSQLAMASHSLAEGCSEQGSAVAETSAALEEMSAMIRSTADNADKAKSFANQARTAAQAGSETMIEMTDAMKAIEASSAVVAQIVKNIDEIAFQTNILALNAAVEAARAGEAGAGFAVVADEVRSLAQRSAAAARETAEKIDAAIVNSRRGSSSCGKVAESLQEIVRKVAAADGLVAEIATAAKEQALGIQQVGEAMTQMDKVTQDNSASAEQSSSAATQFKAQASALQETVLLLRSLVGSTGSLPSGATKAAPQRPVAPPPARGTVRLPQPAPRKPLAVGSRTPVRIPMPQEPGPTDPEDQNFTNF